MKASGVVLTCANTFLRDLRISSIASAEIGEFRNGVHQLGDLWNTKRSRAALEISIPSISGSLVAESRPTAVRRNVQVAELPSSSVTFQRLQVSSYFALT